MDCKEFEAFLTASDDQRKNFLHIAALLDDHFSLNSIIDILDVKPSRLLAFIDEMLRQGIITNTSNSIKGPFAFKDAQFAAVINDIIDHNKRQLNLLKVAGYLDQKAPVHTSHSLHLANLYLQIESVDKRIYYTKKAADLMLSTHRPEEAILLYEKIIDDLLSSTDDIGQNPDTLVDAITSYLSLSVYSPIHRIQLTIDKIISLSSCLSNKRIQGLFEFCLSILLFRQGKYSDAILHRNEGSRIVQEIDDVDLRKLASTLLGLSYFYEGQINTAIQIYVNSLPDIEIAALDWHESWSFLMLARCYGIAGRVSLALGISMAIIQKTASKAYLHTESFANAVTSLILLEVRRLKEAEPYINRSTEIAENIASEYLLKMMKLGKAYLEYSEGHLRMARELVDECMSPSGQNLVIQYPCSWLVELIFALHKVKWEPNYSNTYTAEINHCINAPNPHVQGTALRYYALSIPMSDSGVPKIEQLLKKSYKSLIGSGSTIEAGKTEAELAKFYIRVNNTPGAKKFAGQAYLTLSEIDESLFPSQLSKIIPRKSKDYRKDRGVSEIVGAIEYFPDTHKYLGKLVSILSDMFGADRCAVFMSNSGDNAYRVMATHNFIQDEINQFEDSDVQKILLNLLKKKELVTISDRDMYPIFEQLSTKGIQIRSLALVPIIINHLLAGFIFMDNRLLSGRLSDSDVAILKIIATHIQIAMASFDMYSKIKCFNNSDLDSDDADDLNAFEADFPGIIRGSEVMKEVLRLVRKVAATDTTVLILGETGVGKELIAQAIHQYSDRSTKNFITVNISALTVSLIESELFGYEKGAFTGAVESKGGRFELANGGTIFLDEIGDLSLDVQVKLLRVLQEGTFERVGSGKSIRSDFRLITATNKNLQQMVQKGDFRSDLFYRLNSFPIEVPPLRERKEDILPLALHLMKKYSMKYNKNIRRIGKSEMDKLLYYSWPGNVRELEHTIEKSIILSDNEDLQISEFLGPNSPIPDSLAKTEYLVSLEQIERDHILKVLDHTRWRIRGKNGAAKILGLNPTTLEFRMRKIGIK